MPSILLYHPDSSLNAPPLLSSKWPLPEAKSFKKFALMASVARSPMKSEKWMADFKASLDVDSEDFRSRYQSMRTNIYRRQIGRLQPEVRERVQEPALSLLELIDYRMNYNWDAVKHYQKMEGRKEHGSAVIPEEVAASSIRRRGRKLKKETRNLLLAVSGNKEETSIYGAEIFYDSADAIIERIEPRLGKDVFNLFGKAGIEFRSQRDDLETCEPPSRTELIESQAKKHHRLVIGPPLDANIDTDLIALKIEEYQQLLVGSLVSASFKKRIAEIIRVLQTWLEGRVGTERELSTTLSDLEDEVEDQLDTGYEDLLESIASMTAQRDVRQLEEFLSNSLLEEYGMSTVRDIGRVDQQWKLRGLYLEWKRAPSDLTLQIEARLSDETGVHPSQLDDYIGARLDRMISGLKLDEDWVRGRIWNYANNHARLFECDKLAEESRWEDLARKIVKDRQQLELLIPENAVHADHDRKSNQKGHIHFGIVFTQTEHFAKLKGPDHFVLSKKAKERQRQEKSSTKLGKGRRPDQRQQEKPPVWRR